MSGEFCHCIFYQFDGESCAQSIKSFFSGRRYNVQFSLHKLENAKVGNVSNPGVFILLLTPDSYGLIKSQKHLDLNAIFPSPESSVLLLFSVDKTMTEITTLLSSRIRDFSKWTILEYSTMSSLGIQVMGLVEQLEENSRRVSLQQQVQVWPREGIKSGEQVLLIFTEPVDIDATVSFIQEWDSRTGIAERLNDMTFCFTVEAVEPGEKTVDVLKNDTSFGRVVLHVLEPRMPAIGNLLHNLINPVEFICQCLHITPSTRKELDKGFQELLSKKNTIDSNIFETLYSERLKDSHSNYELPTLLHFCAKHGFELFCMKLLRLPGSKEAMKMKNKDGLLPYQIAQNEGFDHLASVLQNSDNVPCDRSDFDTQTPTQYQIHPKNTSRLSPRSSPSNEDCRTRLVTGKTSTEHGNSGDVRTSTDYGHSDENKSGTHAPCRRMTNVTSVTVSRQNQASPGKPALPFTYGKMKKTEVHYHTIDS
ncbi:hypothetical protein ACJMK2_033325 [Sinanodonta woodiana]|uniref:DBB domain-containing protein n=1 Tax=Sinanodonta woodiana TaxID=1069815 RepID=A0ABD3WN14_SINWO